MYGGMLGTLTARRFCAGLVVGAVVLTGCGGAKSDSAQVRTVAQRYQAALVGQNASDMCSLLSDQAQRDLASLVKVPIGRKGSCPSFARALLSAFRHDAETSARIRAARIGTVKVKGNTATVVVREPGASAREISLVKSNGEWKITLPQPRTSTYFDMRGGPAAITVEPPSSVRSETAAQFDLGRTVAAQAGCLACHRIGEAGNAGPGSDLTHIGSKRSAAAIERAIISPTAPMPSFRHLPKAKLRALVTFLSMLR
jgi:hypothetical protein